MPKLDFVTLDVFTTTPFLGNPLSIVHVPAGTSLSQTEKQTITKEFNLFETVFLHRSLEEIANGVAANGSEEVKIDIFTPDYELPFAGHPTIGAAVYVLSAQAAAQARSKAGSTSESCAVVLQIKAGPTLATFHPQTQRARLSIPHAFTIHSDVYIPIGDVAGVYGIPESSIVPNDLASKGVALASPVDGLGFLLVEMSSLEALSSLRNSGHKFKGQVLGMKKEVEDTPLAVYFYHIAETAEGNTKMRTRMFSGMKEDSATGSAASCLAGYLSIKASTAGKDGGAQRRFEMVQGVEVGRKSEIVVEVKTKEDDSGEYGAETVWLSGAAVQVMEGKLRF